MPITHAFVSGVADGADATLVRPSDQNADHKWLAETADPVSPVQNQVWVLITGTSPTRVASIKIRDAGVTHVIASITLE